MNAIPPIEARNLERLRYWQGQMLGSRDLRDQQAFAAQLRWWHNRAMHQAYGVASGFEVALRDGQVEVNPGRAYDWFGRELILPKKTRTAIPAHSGELALLVRYRETRNYPQKMAMGAACLPGGCDSLLEAADLAWKPVDKLQIRDGVLLAKLDPKRNELVREALSARALSRPRIATGATLAGATLWKPWTAPLNHKERVAFGVQTAIDTSAAGFSETPCYFAWLQHQTGKNERSVMIGHYREHITCASKYGFVFHVLTSLPVLERHRSANPDKAEDAVEHFLRRGICSVNWLAIQCHDTCRPPKEKRKDDCEYPG